MFTRVGGSWVLAAAQIIFVACSATDSPSVLDGEGNDQATNDGGDGDTATGRETDVSRDSSSDSVSASEAVNSGSGPGDESRPDAGTPTDGDNSSAVSGATSSDSDTGSDANNDTTASETTGDDTGSSSAAVGEHCTPGTSIRVYPYDTVQPCQGDLARDHYLPNASNASVLNIELESPTIAGELFAFSVETTGYFSTEGVALEQWPNFIEIWGANELCGAAEKLLWWGPEREGIVCGEFIPDASYSHLLYVTRQHVDFGMGAWSTELVTMCQSGSCPAGAEGEGLSPGKTLNPPLVYMASVQEAVGRNYEVWFSGTGYMMLLFDDTARALGTARPLKKGFFRLPTNNRFSDAWYCVGDGSSVTEGDESVNHLVSLKNITRLPSCETRVGSGTASVTFTSDALELESSFADLQPGALLSESYSACEGTSCEFRFVASIETFYLDRRLYLDLASSVGYYAEPISTPTAILGAHLFHEPDVMSPITVTCSNSGTLSYNPAETTSITLEAMSEYFTCPGEPIDDDSFDFEIANFY